MSPKRARRHLEGPLIPPAGILSVGEGGGLRPISLLHFFYRLLLRLRFGDVLKDWDGSFCEDVLAHDSARAGGSAGRASQLRQILIDSALLLGVLWIQIL